MLDVTVKVYCQLPKSGTGGESEEKASFRSGTDLSISIQRGTTLSGLMSIMGVQEGGWKICLVNGAISPYDRQLQNGDFVEVLPVLDGG